MSPWNSVRFFQFGVPGTSGDGSEIRQLCQVRFIIPFGISARTVARAKLRLSELGEAGFVPPRQPRRRHGIEDAAVLAKAEQMLRAGHSLYRVAKQLQVNCSTLWRYTQEGRLPPSQCPARRAPSQTATAEGEPVAEPAAAALPVPGPAERNQRDAQAPLGRAARDSEGR